MKIIAIGDTHGRDDWKALIEKDADKIVFIGDYFDSWDAPFEKQAKNFADILEFKSKNLDKVVLLVGNHDYHYMSNNTERYSGYQKNRAITLGVLIDDAIKQGFLQMAFQADGILFTHAGVTKTWFKESGAELMSSPTDFTINDFFKRFPEKFKFTPSTALDSCGDSITQTPIWVRPRALESDKIEGLKQVVGHTKVEHITPTDGVTYIDVLDYNKEYLEITDGNMEVKSL